MMGVFREQFSKSIIQAFQKEFDLTSHDVIQRIYHQPRPNHFLASFGSFILQHKNHPEIFRLVQKSFHDFFDAFFVGKNHLAAPFHFSGSIAFHFSDILREVGSERGIYIKNIIQSPIAGLVLYHQKYD